MRAQIESTWTSKKTYTTPTVLVIIDDVGLLPMADHDAAAADRRAAPAAERRPPADERVPGALIVTRC